MRRIGLTGGIGSGKSAVAAMLADRGAVVVDADAVAREVVEPGTEGLAAVVASFGREVQGPDGALDRARLGGIVFGDDEKRARLNAILHPRIARRTAQIMAALPTDAVVVHDVPLLVENGLAAAYDEVVVVESSPQVQLRRLVEQRGMTAADAQARIDAQASPEQRRAVASVLVRNDGTLEELAARVDEVWPRLADMRR